MAAATKAKNRVSANGDGVKPDDKVERLVITPPNLVTGAFNIEGDSPLVIHRFGQKAIEQMKAKQEAGSQATKGRKREPKDFQECFQQSRHISLEGWDGIPAGGFRAAMVDACRLASFKMTVAKLSVFIIADGLDRVDKTGLVRITKGEARYTEHAVRNETGVCDIRARAMFDPGWQALWFGR
jgi:predicted subunit of tRNA(5-methylaminomethyl-2-thiouridylate) methyltransferase